MATTKMAMTMTMKAAAMTTTTTTDDDDDDYCGYNGRDGHHRMREGRQQTTKQYTTIK